MDTQAVSLGGFSDSALEVMGWAGAVAVARSHRAPGTGALTQPCDILLGTRLADPGPNGIAQTLLSHFGLGLGDLLPDDYPVITAAELQQASATSSTPPALTPDAVAVVASAQSLNHDKVFPSHLLRALLTESPSTGLSRAMDVAFTARGSGLSTVSGVYIMWLDSEDGGRSRPDDADSLGAWLKDRVPRDPVFLPDYASDRIDERHDLVGVRAEADAFAYLIASRDLKPPLAIGLFGDWGSGKSFLMRSVQYRISELTHLVADTEQPDAAVWKNITQIEFNAWAYIHGNLWAGLLERIFRELGALPQLPLVKSRLEPIAKEKAAMRLSADKAEGEISRLAGQVQESEKVSREARDKVAEAEKAALEKRERAAEDLLKQRSSELWKVVQERLLGRTGADLLTAMGDVRAEVLRGKAVLGDYWKPWRIGLITVGSVLIPLVAYGLAKLDVPVPVSVLGGLVAMVPIITTALRDGTRQTQAWLQEIEGTMEAISAEGQEQIEQAQREVAIAESALEDKRRSLDAEEAGLRQALLRQAELSDQLASLTTARVFAEFADDRSTDYRRRLGLLSTVREDLRTLEEQVLESNRRALLRGGPEAFEEQSVQPVSPTDGQVPNRIVLYIDDLDRCPPATVVEVLEAVHLLLAFEMFVVVVAVDSRWLSSALTGQLAALRPASGVAAQATPDDYLEKIFQVPFWVRPLTDPARALLIRGLLTPAVLPEQGEETPRRPLEGQLDVNAARVKVLKEIARRSGSALRADTSRLALTQGDVEFIESLAPLLGNTPRRVKRFVNVCRLLLAMPPLLPETPQPSERSGICLLAAVSQGLPSVAEHLFRDIDRSDPSTLKGALAQWVDVNDPQRALLERWLEANPVWGGAPLTRLGIRHDLVRRLRFDAPAGGA